MPFMVVLDVLVRLNDILAQPWCATFIILPFSPHTLEFAQPVLPMITQHLQTGMKLELTFIF